MGRLDGKVALPTGTGHRWSARVQTARWVHCVEVRVRGLTKSAALDLGGSGTRVNSVHPGVIQTPRTEGVLFDTGHVPMRRIGQPSEVADLAVYPRLSPVPKFVVDGGETAGVTTPTPGSDDGQ